MKKTMIALAAIAAVGAASAQVSITGEAAWGFHASTSGAGVSASGLGIDTAQLKFSAKEDLGNGMSVSAGLSLNTGNHSAGTSSDDQSITLSTPMAAVSLLTYKPGDWVSGASGAATWYGLDGKALSARSTRDAIAITLPLATGLSLTAAYLEPGNSLGEGAGSSGSTGQSVYNLGVKYATGPATLQAAFLQYTNVDGTLDTSANTVTRLGGKVDLGVATVGAGLQIIKTGAGGTNTQSALSVSAPLVGGLSAQAVYAANNTDYASTSALAALNGRRTGYMLGLQYNLSKRTYAILNSGSWRGIGASAIDAQDSSMYAMTLVHDF